MKIKQEYGWVIWSLVNHTLDGPTPSQPEIYRTKVLAEREIKALGRSSVAVPIKVPLYVV